MRAWARGSRSVVLVRLLSAERSGSSPSFAHGKGRVAAIASIALASACTTLLPASDPLEEAPGRADTGEGGAASDADPLSEGLAHDEGTACPRPSKRRTVRVEPTDLREDTRWTCEHDYELLGPVAVTRGTLRVDPGVRVRAHKGAFLLIGSEARLEARGTPSAPIVFTAAKRPAEPGAWRGIFMLGLAQTALPNNATLGFAAGDSRAFFGGNDDQHDCGALEYVRVEFAGGSTNEYDFPGAAVTLAGCGRDTRIDRIQVHAATDGIGLVGGTAPLKRVLVSAPGADGIEWAAGYRGFLQFVVVQSFYGAGAALKGSRSDADETTLPASAPTLYNVTLAGARTAGLPRGPADPNGFETGIQLQAGTGATVRNALVHGFAGAWLDILGASTAALVETDVHVTNTIFTDPGNAAFPGGGVEAGDGEDDDGGFAEDDHFRLKAWQNRFPAASMLLRDPYAVAPRRPDFSADGFVDGGNLADAAPPDFEDLWEPAFFAGALPKVQFDADRALDWTRAEDGDSSWTAFPQE